MPFAPVILNNTPLIAQRIGVPTTGTLGVLLAAKRRGLIPTVAHPIAVLQNAGLYFKADLIDRVLAMAGE